MPSQSHLKPRLRRLGLRPDPAWTPSPGPLALVVVLLCLTPAVADVPQDQARPAIGITFAMTASDPRVLSVVPGSPAEAAGFKAGDQIVAVDDQPVRSRSEVIEAVARKRPDDQVRIRFLRNGQEYNVLVNMKPRREIFRAPQEEQSRMAAGESGAWLGLSVQSAAQPGRERRPGAQGPQQTPGVEVDEVYPAGPAARAGLYAGDVIAKVDGKDISSPEDLANVVREKKAGDKINLLVSRGGQLGQLSVVAGDRRLFFPPSQQVEGYGAAIAGREGGQAGPAPWAIQLEQERHAAVQRQRIEDLVDSLSQEVRSLRQEIEQLRAQVAGTPARPTPPALDTSPRTGQRPDTQGASPDARRTR